MSNPKIALAESVSTSNASYFIFVYILVLIYCCFALAVVCDVYFVPALQKLSSAYNLPPDIAGSTLMALGASVPELFASLIGVFVTKDDIGTGSIIGSSCFNLIAVPAACAFVASASFPQKLKLTPMPIIRNSAFYAITILVLLLIIKDNKVDIPEALILLLFFVMYMALMVFSVQSKKSFSISEQQSKQQRSNTSFHISTDSAIAECNSDSMNSKRDSSPYQTQFNPQHSKNSGDFSTLQITQPGRLQQAYGQIYFAPDSDNNIKRQQNYKSFSERTPLVSEVSSIKQNNYTQLTLPMPIQFAGSQETHKQHHMVPVTILTANANETRDNSSIPGDLASDSLDLGVALKNSTCLSANSLMHLSDNLAAYSSKILKKDYYDLDAIVGKQEQQQRRQFDEHEENWVSSNWILIPLLPLTLSMKVLTPCKFKNTCWTIWTFLVSITLIGGLTYISVWMVHLFGQTVGIPETVSGMTILSWGTGIPELIASIVLIKKTAQADMAICNTIGSNVIDVSFCLSLPWIVKCIIDKSAGLKPEVQIQSAALPWTSFLLLVSVFLLILIFKLHDWKLNCSVGVWLTMVYLAFVAAATFLEASFSESGIDLMSFI